MNSIVILLIIIPFIASSLTLLNRCFPHLPIARLVGLGAVSLCLIFLTFLLPGIFGGETIDYPVGGWMEPVGINLYMDGLAWISSLMGMVITLFALIYAAGEGGYDYKFYFFFLTLLGGMQGVILTQDIFNMFVFFEILSIASYILIAYPRKENSIIASFNYLLISTLGIGFFLLGVALLYQQTGVLSLREMIGPGSGVDRSSFTFSLALIFLVVGIGVKAAFVPLHTWLPDAHAFAPHPVSAILSGVMIKVSFLAVWRIIRLFQFADLHQLFLWIGGITALLGVIRAMAQDDGKKLLAYSSISQMGFIIAGFGAATSLSLTASFYHLLNHSLFKSLLFLSIGAVIYTTGKRKIGELRGLAKKMPLVFIAFLIGALSISGIPPFNGYISKSLISLSLKPHPFVYLLIFLTSVGTVASFIKLSRIFAPERAYRGEGTGKKIPEKMLIPLILLSLLCLITGIFPYTGVISQLLLGERLGTNLSFYSLSELVSTVLILGLGFILYLFISGSKGKRILEYVKNTSPGLNDSLLLFVAGFLFFVLLIWVMGMG